jgi:putative solute:sodium symporter small subunit
MLSLASGRAAWKCRRREMRGRTVIDDEQRRLHSHRSLRLLLATLAAFVMLTLIVPLIVPSLNAKTLLNFPLGLLVLSHGTIVGIISLIYWASARQDALDRRYGMTSEF